MEWLTGIGRLPASEYSRYFTMPIKQILSKPLEWKQTWFQIIRQARILLDTSHLFNDEFATSHVLQKWAGIEYSITDEEATPSLYYALKQEFTIGLGSLPATQYQTFFYQPYSIFIQNKS